MRTQTTGEEIANSIIHGIGTALSVAALVILMVFAASSGDGWRVTSLAIYGTTLIFLYLMSTLYHSISNQRAKRIFRIMDHSSIFILIAGTYTPIVLVTLRGPWGWTLFGVIWGIAIVGIVFKFLWVDRFRALSISLYIAMGWLILIAVKPLIEFAPPKLILWIFLGGICYTFGILFYRWKRLPYHHAVWHLFVMAGSIMHFFGLLFHVAS